MNTTKFMALCGVRVGVAVVSKIANQFSDHPERTRYQVDEVVADAAHTTTLGESFTVGRDVDSVYVFDTAKEAAAKVLEHLTQHVSLDLASAATRALAVGRVEESMSMAERALATLKGKTTLLKLSRG